MSRVLKGLRALLLRNVGWKLLALAIAYVIWVSVAIEPELATSATVRLEYKDLPNNLEISSMEPSDNVVTLELRGPSGQLQATGTTGGLRPAVVLDMSGVQPGIRTFAIVNADLRLPRGVRLVRATPSEARFRFERRLSRSVPVSVRFTGQGGDAYEVADYEVTPPRLTIVGPASHVERITQVVTDPVDLTGVVGAAQFHVNAYVNDSYVRFDSSPRVTVAVSMRKKGSAANQ